MLLGASSADQLLENIGAIQVSWGPAGCQARCPTNHPSGRDLLSACYAPGTRAPSASRHTALLWKSRCSSQNRQYTENSVGNQGGESGCQIGTGRVGVGDS